MIKRLLGIFIVSILMFNGCEKAPVEPKLTRMTIYLGQWVGYGLFYLAQEKGFLKQEGIELVAIDELQEFNLGNHSGQIIGPWFEDWRSGGVLSGGETYRDFTERCLKSINRSLTFPESVLIIAHGGVYWALVDALQVHLAEDLPNCVPLFLSPPQKENEKWKISLIS